MEITEVTTHVVEIPLTDIESGGVAPFSTNHNSLETMQRVLVRVETNGGITGWGESRVFLEPSVSQSILEEGIAPMVIGKSPYEVEGFRRQLFTEYVETDMFFAPIEIACWDLIGQDQGKPVYKLLGGWTAPTQTERKHRNHLDETESDREVDLAYALGVFPVEQSREYAQRALEQGFNVLKTKAGQSWETDVRRIIAMNEAVDGQLDFRIDPNQGWTVEDALRVATKLEDENIYLQYMEQPIRINSPSSLEKLRERTKQPIAANEDTYPNQNLFRLLAVGAIDVGVVDMTPAGGISGLRQLAGIAEEAGISLAHHNAFDLGIRTAAVLHSVYGIPGINLEYDNVYFGWEDDVLHEPFEISDGRMQVPDDPGLGIDVDIKKIRHYEIT